MNSSNRQIELSPDDLRAVARFTAACAREALVLFERTYPDDRRPRSAVESAEAFAAGGRRSNDQRTTAFAAHRASREATDQAAQLAARAAGDAAASAYLHPLAQPSQVGHILGAASNAARAFEVDAGGDPAISEQWLAAFQRHATPQLRNVLAHYPDAPVGATRVSELMGTISAALRSTPEP